ncbi:MAG: S-layer homology domain-containing protein [Lachnospiraceae bacterium]|nr:S-layer homology domain-containing protein [Lachnospiraceae bacterium]
MKDISKRVKRILACVLAVVLLAALLCFPALAEEADSRAVVTGTFPLITDMDIATIRYYTDAAKTDYAFAEFTYDENSKTYTYSFQAPYDGFEALQASSLDDPEDSATVIAEYYSTTVWDGAVDVSWYNETDTDFYIYDPAQLAGVAAVTNGSVDGTTYDYQVKGFRSSLTDRSVNRGLPDCIESTYYEKTNLIAGVEDEAWKGVMKHDFANRTIHIMSDMDMGGVSGSEIVMGNYNISTDEPDSNWNRNLYNYPNWTPIGGEYLMDVADGSTMIIAFFNGTIEGHGHNIHNLYCYRWSYRSVGETAYGYCQGVGLVGIMGSLYDDDRGKEENPSVMPAIRDLGLDGFIYGRRMIGGFVGCIGGGKNAADGTSIPGGIALENLANHAYVYCTDSKGLGGIVGCSMAAGSIINCYNTGNLNANYAAPTGGIIGSNESMDIFCCYNSGTVYTNGNTRGRGIGSDNSGSQYSVDNCAYLENCGDDPLYPGYYTYHLAPSVSVNVTEMTAAQMQSNTLLQLLNANGTAYCTGDDGYPILYWEKGSDPGSGSLSLLQAEGGTVSASAEGYLANGTIVYLSNTADAGYNFRNYTLNGDPLSGDYVTVNGDAAISAYFESSKAGVLKIEQNKVCNVTVKKNGIIMDSGQVQAVENYPVAAGDSIYEGDVLIVEAAIKDGMVPEDPSLQYSATADLANPFRYEYTYTGSATQSTSVQTYTVTDAINREDVSLTLHVVPLTTQKLWRYVGDTSWYNETDTVFILRTANQLAGLQILVQNGTDFSGKTIKLENDISLANNDGTTGTRYWDGIGTYEHPFAGSFDGQGYKITDLNANMYGLFAYCYATENMRASIKNLDVYGNVKGVDASGIVSRAKYTDIENCNSYCALFGSSGYSGGILGYAQTSCTVNRCVNYGKIQSVGRTGGIIGELSANSKVSDCINKGDMSCRDTGGNCVGGVAGSLNGTLFGCANYGNILAYGRSIGGIAGQSVSKSARIESCYSVGTITYQNGKESQDSVGGIIGYGSFYNISNSFYYGTIDIQTPLTGNHLGGIIGKDGRQSTSLTKSVYYLDSGCAYATDGIKVNELPDAVFCAGINSAAASDFASNTGVLESINSEQVFQLKNGQYPELVLDMPIHEHTGGTATCSSYAVCEVCGLEYGDYDPDHHSDVTLIGYKEPIWCDNGYSGDRYCRGCQTLIEEGKEIPANTGRNALTVEYIFEGQTVKTQIYTVAELDSLKITDPAIGYSYGSNSTEIMAATEYVPISSLLEQDGCQLSDFDTMVVICDGSSSTLTAQDLIDKCWYYDADGNKFSAPAAISMKYTSLSGSLEEVAAESRSNDNLRFGYGISEAQYEEQADLGGKRLVSPVRAIRFVLNTLPPALENQFDDVQNSGVWYYETVYTIAKTKNANGKALMSGYGNSNNFGPTDPLTRQDFAVILYRLADEPAIEEMENPFTDTKENGYYYTCVLWAKANNVIAGYNDGRFGVGDKITREQVATILYRFAKDYLKLEASEKGDLNTFSDGKAISSWAEDALTWATGAGIITGKSNGTQIDARGNAARSEIGAMILRFMKYIEKN